MKLAVIAAVPFVHPALAGAALATGLIPILIHLINRRRYRRTPWAAMTFLLAAKRRNRRRLRFQQLLLMCLRVLVLIILGLALARPYLPAHTLLPSLGATPSHRIIVLDNSLSMSAKTEEGGTRFDAAKQLTERLISLFPAGDRISLVTLAKPATPVLANGSADPRIIRDRLNAIVPTQAADDSDGAVDQVLQILSDATSAPENRSVHWISDFAGSSWSAETTRHAPGAAIIGLRRIADALPDSSKALSLLHVDEAVGANTALTGLRVESSLATVNAPIRLSVEATNHSRSTVSGQTVQVLRDGEIVRRVELPAINPGEATTISLSMAFASPDQHVIEARLVQQDALSQDDARFVALDVQAATSVLLVDGRPGRSPLQGAAGFVATALAPRTETPARRITELQEGISSIETSVITPSEFGTTALADVDVVIMCNVGELQQQQWKTLEGHVTGGGGLIVFAGDLVNAEHYNQFGYADANGVLPARWAVNVPPRIEPSFIDDKSLSHPMVGDFRGHADSGLFLARTDRYLPLQRDATRCESVLRFTNGEDAVVAAKSGEGKVIMIALSANMDWTNLPAKGDFVSLMVNAVAFASREHGRHRNVEVGQSVVEPLTAAQSSSQLRVSGPDGVPLDLQLIPLKEGLALSVGPFEQAGVARTLVGVERRPIAINVNPAESDLQAPVWDDFLEALDRPIQAAKSSSGIDVAAKAAVNELSGLMLYAVAALLLLEMWAAMWAGHDSA